MHPRRREEALASPVLVDLCVWQLQRGAVSLTSPAPVQDVCSLTEKKQPTTGSSVLLPIVYITREDDYSTRASAKKANRAPNLQDSRAAHLPDGSSSFTNLRDCVARSRGLICMETNRVPFFLHHWIDASLLSTLGMKYSGISTKRMSNQKYEFSSKRNFSSNPLTDRECYSNNSSMLTVIDERWFRSCVRVFFISLNRCFGEIFTR